MKINLLNKVQKLLIHLLFYKRIQSFIFRSAQLSISNSIEQRIRLKYIAENRSSLKKKSDNAKLTLPEYKSLINTVVEQI